MEAGGRGLSGVESGGSTRLAMTQSRRAWAARSDRCIKVVLTGGPHDYSVGWCGQNRFKLRLNNFKSIQTLFNPNRPFPSSKKLK
jgi:hypothetical protein